MSNQHTTPCRECPWRKQSAPGYLGASNPIEFLETSETGIKMPCHLAVDYEEADWELQIEEAPHCAGRAIHYANRAKRGDDVPKMPADRENVFSNPQDFIDHHTHGKGPKIMIIGCRVVPMEGQ
jgi:hypothetical protein